MQCIPNDWYPETSIFMLYAAVNATRSPKKRPTGMVCTKSSKPSNEIKLSWYRSIDKKHFWVYTKFEVGLSIPFTRKMRSKKVKLFPRGWSQMAGFANYKIWEIFSFLPRQVRLKMQFKKIISHISAHIHPFNELMEGAWWYTLSARFLKRQINFWITCSLHSKLAKMVPPLK
jgi:hypothetical protein